MGRYKVEYDRAGCIGAFVCTAMNPENFKEADDGKADLINGKDEGDLFTFETDDISKLLKAAEGCPVNVIHIIDTKTGKRLI